MRLDELLAGTGAVFAGAGDIAITGVTADSRAARPGMLFVAVPGSKVDGAQFVPQAVAAGAAAVVVGEHAVLAPVAVPVARAADPRHVLARIAARLHGPQPAMMVAVTGTSGKSSVAEFTRQIFASLGRQAASVGTIGVVKPDGAVYGSLTTPDPVTLHQTLAALGSEGITHVAFEASSHGLDQHRLDGVTLRAAAFTNLGRDHMDYHATIEDYFAAKLRLFTELLPADATAVVNIDDPFGRRVANAVHGTSRRLITVGGVGADLALVATRPVSFNQLVDVGFGGRTWSFGFPLLGRYQVENFLLAAGLAIACGEPADAIFASAGAVQGVPGRLEIVGSLRDSMVVVDYAHKPDALAAVLAALRPFVTGKLVCVFGCGGDRDTGKRPIMGEIASRGADVVIVTDDNPRSEQPAAIRAEILAAAPGAIEIGDRAEAIRRAIALAGPGDVVVIAGKGHETGQIVGDRVLPFSDQGEARAAISAEGGDA